MTGSFNAARLKKESPTTWIVRRPLAIVALGLSACGFPLTELVIRRWGARGAVVVEAVCVGLVIRDTAMIATGVPGRLRRSVAMLLWLELGAGVVAALAGLGPVLRTRAASRPVALEIARRAAVGTLFGLHTLRFAIYLRPDQGRRVA